MGNERVEKIKNVLERLYHRGERVRIFYGENGEMWLEDYGVVGYIARSTGPKPIYILVYDNRASGGGAIVVEHIVKIISTKSHVVFYDDGTPFPEFKLAKPKADSFSVFNKDKTGVWKPIALFQSEDKAKRWIAFMLGKRFSK